MGSLFGKAPRGIAWDAVAALVGLGLAIPGCFGGNRPAAQTFSDYAAVTKDLGVSPGTGAVSGEIVRDDGVAVAGAEATFTLASITGSVLAASDDNGLFALGHLPPGTYDVSVQATDTGGSALTATTTVRVVGGSITAKTIIVRPPG